MGMVARKMETAPRRPAQETNSFSFSEKWNGARQANTAAGRPTRMRNAATPSAGSAYCMILLGDTSMPSITNITIWQSQVIVSRNDVMEAMARTGRFPTTSPAR